MRYAIVSDIHANIQAWTAVMRDMELVGVDSILCLGDVIGYGPNPVEVLDSCYKHCDHFILGNHDAVIGNRLDSDLFNDNAKFLIEWTREQLSPAAGDFFADMPLRMEGDGFVCAHGELALPGRFGYIYEAQDAIASFTSNDSPIMFVGHTHFPAKFTFDFNTNQVQKEEAQDFIMRPDQRYLINAGSVGDPRDGQTTASYCIYDAEKKSVIYRQVPFDIAGFRQNLRKTQLPVNPFFLRVLDGQINETETIRDMQKIEANQAKESPVAAEKISSSPEDAKKRRQKLTFSQDSLRQTRQLNKSQGSRKKAEAASQKESKKIIGIVAGVFVLLLIIAVVILKAMMPEDNNSTSVATQEAAQAPQETVEEVQLDLGSEKSIESPAISVEPVFFEDFEGDHFAEGWFTRDRAFGYQPLNEERLCAGLVVKNFSGKTLAGSAHRYYKSKRQSLMEKGYLFSPPFKVEHRYIHFLAKGSGDDSTQAIIVVKGAGIKGIDLKKGWDNGLEAHVIDVGAYRGQEIQLAFRDNSEEHAVFVDAVIFSDDDSVDFKTSKIKYEGSPFTGDTKAGIDFTYTKNMILLNKLKSALKSIDTRKELDSDAKVKYKAAINSLGDFSKKIMMTYRADIGQQISFVHKAASKTYRLEITEADDNKVMYKELDKPGVGELRWEMLSEEEKIKRSEKLPNGMAAYWYQKNSLKDNLSSDFIQSPELREMLMVSSSSQSDVIDRVFKTKTLEFWLETELKSISSMSISVNGDSRKIDAKFKSIADLYPHYEKSGFAKINAFRVAVFELPQEVNIDFISVLKVDGGLSNYTLVSRDATDKISWSLSVMQESNIFKTLPKKMWFNRKYAQPPFENLALGKPIISDNTREKWQGLTDGVWSERAPFCFSTAAGAFPKSVTVDLENLTLANAIKLASPQRGSTKALTVEISEDGQSYTNLGKIHRKMKNDYQFTLFFKERKIRYVRVTFNENHEEIFKSPSAAEAFLGELEVYRF